MNMRFALLALLLLGISFAGISISNIAVSPAIVEPGTSGVLTFTVSNDAAVDVVQNVAVQVSSTQDLAITRSISVGDLEASSSTVLSVPFQASPSIKSGYYTAQIDAAGTTTIYYYSANMQDLKSKTDTVQKSASAAIPVVNKPQISVGLSQDTLQDITPETFKFTNSGGAANRLKAVIVSPGIGLLNIDQLYIDQLNASSQASASIDARGASEGATKLAIQLTYQDELGNQITENKEVPVTVKKPEGEFVFSQKAPIVTGKNENLGITISNLGGDITNLKFTFANESVRLRGMNEMRVGDLSAGFQKAISVPVVAELSPGTQNVVLYLTWVENGEDRMGTLTVPIEVISDSNVGVYLEAKPAPLLSGAEHTISVTVSNLGSYPIEGTTVELSSDALTLLTIQPEQYIGGLQSDDFSSVQYSVRVNNVAPGNYPAKIMVKFRDASGEWMTLQKDISISVAAPPAQEGSIIPFAIGAVIIVAALYWWFKRRKK